MANDPSGAAKAALKAYRSKPVVIDEVDEDAYRIMHPDRQQGFLDALTDLCRQWGIRIKDMQTSDLVRMVALSKSFDPRGQYHLDEDGKILWFDKDADDWQDHV